MKSSAHFLVFFLLVLVLPAAAQNVGINGDGSTPYPGAMLDVKSSNKGILIPRVALTGKNDLSTVPLPTASLLVYNTATAGSGNNLVEPGFYYWTGSAWTRILSGNMPAAGWSLSGNAGTIAGTHFIGTTDGSPLQFRVNNRQAGRIDGQFNSFYGYQAGLNLINGYGNTGIGQNALVNITSGFDNIGLGEGVLLSATTGSNNVAVGKFALSNSNAEANVAVGNTALVNNTTGIENTAVGTYALHNISDGSSNSALGFGSRTAFNNQSNVTLLGAHTYANCSNCVILGSVGGVNGASSSVNVGIGTINPEAALDVRRTAGATANFHGSDYTSHFNYGNEENTYLRGGKAGASVIINDFAGAGNVGIGTGNPEASLDVARTTATTANFRGTVFNSHFMFGNEEHTYIRGGKAGSKVLINDFTGAGHVGIGTSNPAYTLDVYGAIRCVYFIETSDARLKTNIQPISGSTNGLFKLNGYRYQWKDTAMGSSMQIGLLAQEVQQVFPELVSTDEKGQLGVNYIGLIPVLLEAVKELKKENEELKNLKQEIAELKKMIGR